MLPNGVAKSFTFDNGPEFSRHEDITHELGAKVFFTKAYAAWQKGSIENFNRNVRIFLSRKADLDKIEEWKLQGLIDLINNRPKKCLGFLTPAEVFSSELEKLAYSCTSN
ncbi:MAG: hypothetical protein A2218_08955 [Elusimicrobia bacterium RIFOXYA2_FULL_53_38]|nr:MAG: hypothetical protein A2218_08955 [Elusimicrobia bacterium RIFOXYA2_FULL_53_38]